ncbi:hypothetical protein LSH36_1333g00027 [Paralvinella palmiformis]|uniref:Uncharacterized protein n=1 Tax=Paralvinella palmiformis TaxID=53620 RepID=A0AAD9ITW6_9ANNE|nr:hypothetical protein LSH36_1333g00027 [Paralvinella palmiformis]
MSYQPRRTIGPRRKWNSLRAANRIPEVELERKVAEINRHRAVSKREMLVEEGRLWSEMFENHKVLRTSIARYPEQEVIRRLILVEKDNAIDEPQPYSEYYRQFIIFKARLMSKMFATSSKRPPRYSELYYKEMAPARNNKANIERLLKRCQQDHISDKRILDALDNRWRPRTETDEHLAHFPFTSDETTSEFAGRKLTGKSNGDKLSASESNISQKMTNDQQSADSTGSQTTTTETAPFYMPSISDRFRLKKDRQIKKDVGVAEEGHVSPLPEVKRKASLPEIFKRRRSLLSSSSSSDDD